jgi:ribosomal protein S7
MQTAHDRLGALAEAVAKAEPDFDEPARRVALATYRRLAEAPPLRQMRSPSELARASS